MRKFLSALVLITITTAALAADVPLGWKNGVNPTATTNWLTIVLVGYSPGVNISNYVASTTVNWPTTNAVVTNLPSATRCYFVVIHSDLQDNSDPSNEINVKTKVNPPTNLIKQ